MTVSKIAFVAASSDSAQKAYRKLSAKYDHVPPAEADVIVALGGDGHMLETLHAWLDTDIPIYGMNRGTVGFLMNEYRETSLVKRLANAERVQLRPLEMTVQDVEGNSTKSVAINCKLYHIRQISTSCISNRGHLVYVYAKLGTHWVLFLYNKSICN